MIELLKKLPKAELHLHIEGSLEPELMFKLAQKNSIDIPYKTVEDIKNAYNFTNLQSFLDIYYSGAAVLITKEDFYELTWAYILKCVENNIIHTEIFFDPQTHTSRGILFETVISGIKEALFDGKQMYGITSNIILCFLRHLSQEEAFKTLDEAISFKEDIIGIGLDSSEIGHPPSKFENVFKKAKEEGFKLVAHAGEEADVSYIFEALDLLKVQRIDHGVQSINSNKLMERLKKEQIPLTVCPNSNIELKVFDSYEKHNIKKLLDFGLLVTVNSDDPAYFKGYLNQNFINLIENLNLNEKDIVKLVKNSFEASFISDELKQKYLEKVDESLKIVGMRDILNYIKINENISTSGQPTREQFRKIADEGFEVVINLSVAHSEGRLEKEDEIVSDLEMNYFHIPVEFKEPKLKNLKDFIELLSSQKNKKVWVHCIKNYRVSAFMYVYHKYILKTPFEDINLKVFEDWNPDKKWQEIMKTPIEEII